VWSLVWWCRRSRFHQNAYFIQQVLGSTLKQLLECSLTASLCFAHAMHVSLHLTGWQECNYLYYMAIALCCVLWRGVQQ
jgi:hypothetical protein